MRRDARKHENTQKSKNIFYIGGSILGIGIIAFVLTFILYGNKMEQQSDVGNSKIAQLMQEKSDEAGVAEAASSRNGKNCGGI